MKVTEQAIWTTMELPSAGARRLMNRAGKRGRVLDVSADEEDRLLRQCQQGSDDACRSLIGGVQERLFRLAWRMTGDAALAEEATAHALVKLWSKARQWRGQSSARTWIDRLAVRAILDVQRGQKRWWRRWGATSLVVAVEHRPGPAESAEQSEERRVLADRIQAALAAIDPVDRALVHWFYFEDRSLAEIADILGIHRDALKMRLSRARQRLRKILETDRDDK